jgi:hypothetical protein
MGGLSINMLVMVICCYVMLQAQVHGTLKMGDEVNRFILSSNEGILVLHFITVTSCGTLLLVSSVLSRVDRWLDPSTPSPSESGLLH